MVELRITIPEGSDIILRLLILLVSKEYLEIEEIYEALIT